MDRSRGQASIETALLLPALLALTLACWQALLVGWTAIAAEHAARAAAHARLVGAPVQPAAARLATSKSDLTPPFILIPLRDRQAPARPP